MSITSLVHIRSRENPLSYANMRLPQRACAKLAEIDFTCRFVKKSRIMETKAGHQDKASSFRNVPLKARVCGSVGHQLW